MKVRIGFIDNLKGFAILLVVIGHVIQFMTNPNNYLYDDMWRYIYSFHMQLFVMVSGLLAKTDIKTISIFYKISIKRFKQLMIPFLIWTGILTIASGRLSFFLNALVNPGDGYWFLWVIFFVSISFSLAAYISNRIDLRLPISLLGVFLLMILIAIVLNNKFDSNRIYRLFPFYVLGYYLNNSKLSLLNSNLGKILFGGAFFVIHVLLAKYWYPSQPIENIVSVKHLNIIISSLPYRMITALIGCITYYLLFQSLSLFRNKRVFKVLGTRTLGIYVIHLLIVNLFLSKLNIYIHGGLLSTLLITVILTSISTLFVMILEKSTVLNKMFLGRF